MTRRGPSIVVVLAVAAAVALMIGLAVATPGAPDRTPPEPASEALAAPHGARWVGVGGVVLAVPSAWADSQYGCEDDPRPAVVYDAGYWTTCQDTGPGREQRPAALWVLTTRAARSGYGGEAYLKAHVDLPRLGARRSEPWREGGDAGGYWYQSLVVPSAHGCSWRRRRRGRWYSASSPAHSVRRRASRHRRARPGATCPQRRPRCARTTCRCTRSPAPTGPAV